MLNVWTQNGVDSILTPVFHSIQMMLHKSLHLLRILIFQSLCEGQILIYLYLSYIVIAGTYFHLASKLTLLHIIFAWRKESVATQNEQQLSCF